VKVLNEKRCIIGEGPIWNEKEQALYFTNGFQKEVCIYNFMTEQMHMRTEKVQQIEWQRKLLLMLSLIIIHMLAICMVRQGMVHMKIHIQIQQIVQ